MVVRVEMAKKPWKNMFPANDMRVEGVKKLCENSIIAWEFEQKDHHETPFPHAMIQDVEPE